MIITIDQEHAKSLHLIVRHHAFCCPLGWWLWLFSDDNFFLMQGIQIFLILQVFVCLVWAACAWYGQLFDMWMSTTNHDMWYLMIFKWSILRLRESVDEGQVFLIHVFLCSNISWSLLFTSPSPFISTTSNGWYTFLHLWSLKLI